MSVRILPTWFVDKISAIKKGLDRERSQGRLVRVIGLHLIVLHERDAQKIEQHKSFEALCRYHFGFGEDHAQKYMTVAKHFTRAELRSCRLGVTALDAIAAVDPMHRKILLELGQDNSVTELLRAAAAALGLSDYAAAREAILGVLRPGTQKPTTPQPKPRPAVDLPTRLNSILRAANRLVLDLTLACKQRDQGGEVSERTLAALNLRKKLLDELIAALERPAEVEERRQTPRAEEAPPLVEVQAPKAPQAPHPPAQPAAATAVDEAGAAEAEQAHPPDCEATPAADQTAAAAAEPEQPQDPDAPLITAFRSLDRATREALCEDLYKIMTDAP